MTDYVYDKSGQRIFFVREGTTYGDPYDPESQLYTFGTNSSLGDTPIPADYPHWRRFDLIPDAVDIMAPLIKKLEQYDISDLKHPSQILSGNYEPQDFTLDMIAQGCEFLPLSVGAPSLTSHDQAMIQTITCPVESGNISQGDYFLIDAITSNVTEHFAVWMDTAGDGSTGKPTITGIGASNVLAANISGTTPNSTATQVATAVATIINGDATFGATSSGAVVTVTHAAAGAVQMAHDSGAAPVGITARVTQWGSTEYTVTESVSTSTPSFTIHLEQQNTTTAEDIVWDLYGCVVESVALDMTWGDGVGKCSVTFKCPFALKSSVGRNTNNPPRKYIQAFPVMNAIQESNNNTLLMDTDTTTAIVNSTGDRTPHTVEKMVLEIKNNIEFKSDTSKRYAVLPCSGKREITLKLVGNTKENELFNYYMEAFTNDGSDWYPTNSSGKLHSVVKLQRDASYDFITIGIRNWWIAEHNFSFVDVDEAVKAVDITLKDGTPDSNGRIISSFTYQSYVDETIIVG